MNTQPNETRQQEHFTFQAEVARVLDIVIHSLYTDREIFVRELISNAVDALEKVRHITLTQTEVAGKDLELRITITPDEAAKTLTFTDTGIGMTRDELIANLGSVAHSGSREFLDRIEEHLKKDVSLIGQFGVGFYSAFMAASKVVVETRSYRPEETGYVWESDGSGGYTIAPRDGLERGTRITLHLKDDAVDFARDYMLERIVKNYSNFVPFPIYLKDKKLNTVQAIWARSKSTIKDEEYTEFYKYIAGQQANPLTWMHFTTDAPLALNALVYIPTDNFERFGFNRFESNVDLHCRKVLIQKNAKDILPPWLRFLRGVIDSDDLPLNISRETMQDSALIRRINSAVTGRFIKFLEDLAANESETFKTFWSTFGVFIKEGVVTGYEHTKALAKILRYESSKSKPGELVSLEEYAHRMPADQKEIYYLYGPNRAAIESGPYIEIFRKRDIEILYAYDTMDDFVMSHVGEFEEKKIVSADSEKLELPDRPVETPEAEKPAEMTKAERANLADWIRKVLQERITEARASERLVESPMILVNPEGEMTPAMQRLMQAMGNDAMKGTKRILEFNPNHALVRSIDRIRKSDETLASQVIEQLYEMAALVANLPVEPQKLAGRLHAILEKTLGDGTASR